MFVTIDRERATHLAHARKAADRVHFDDAVLREAERVLEPILFAGLIVVVVTVLYLLYDVVRDLRKARDALARQVEAVHRFLSDAEVHFGFSAVSFQDVASRSGTIIIAK